MHTHTQTYTHLHTCAHICTYFALFSADFPGTRFWFTCPDSGAFPSDSHSIVWCPTSQAETLFQQYQTHIPHAVSSLWYHLPDTDVFFSLTPISPVLLQDIPATPNYTWVLSGESLHPHKAQKNLKIPNISTDLLHLSTDVGSSAHPWVVGVLIGNPTFYKDLQGCIMSLRDSPL